MKKCDCYHIQSTIKYKDDCIPFMAHDGVCWGTREQDICSCGGDKTKCDFYPEVREKALQEMEPEFGEWVSVEDRLPDVDNDYLCAIQKSKSKYVTIRSYSQKRKWYGISFGYYYSQPNVTHWMPLPEPPKGE
jgi:hypothetical protein